VKIALFVHCFLPEHFYGTETYTFEIARNLREMGHCPVVVSAAFQGEPAREAPVTHYEYEDIPVYCIDKNSFPVRQIRDTYYQITLREVFKRILSEIDPDLVHVTHLTNHTSVLLDVIAELDIPAIATLTDFFGFCFNQRLEAADGSLCHGPSTTRRNCVACALKETAKKRARQSLFRLLAKSPWPQLGAEVLRFFRPGRLAGLVLDIVERPDVLALRYQNYRAVIAPTRFLASAYLANGLKSPLHLMHFGVDMRSVPKVPTGVNCPLRFGFIGQLAAHKGPDILIDAFRGLPKGAAELKIFGSAKKQEKYMEGLMQRAQGYAVSFGSTFPSERMPDVFAELDCLVIPSRWYENSPLVLLNALASHTPVIVSDVDGMTEFVTHGENGFVFRRGSVNELEKVMQALVKDPTALRAMTDATNYPRSTRQMTEDVVALYESVLNTSTV